MKSFVCLLSRRRRKPLRKLRCKWERQGKQVQKISNRWIWPMGPTSSKCACPQHCPQTLGRVFTKRFPKTVFNSCIDQFLTCALPCSQVYSSQKQMYLKSHEPQLPWATAAPGLLGSSQPCPPATCDRKDRKNPTCTAVTGWPLLFN